MLSNICTCAWPRTPSALQPSTHLDSLRYGYAHTVDPATPLFLYPHVGLTGPQEGCDWAALVGTECRALREAKTVGWPHPELVTARSIRKCPCRKWHPRFRLNLILPYGPWEKSSVDGCGLLRFDLGSETAVLATRWCPAGTRG